MEAITLPIYNSEGKEIDTIKLNTSVFDGKVNTAAIYQAVSVFRANQRKGLAATKTRGEVSGGGKKPWRQKGTGRARVGSSRNPLWRHGGVVFGPHPRDFSYTLPEKIKSLALKSCLNAKVGVNNLVILDEIKLQSPKTKEAQKIFSLLKAFPDKGKKTSILFLANKPDKNLKLAVRNIAGVDLNQARDTHAYEVLAHRKVVITKAGLNDLVERLKK
ncbi:MAG: 50S ribosomal protein L4 [Candidatus Omnitrophica bacterium]|nr:50S ribosomal protein L4 [Candidatus Omnitrophota bacterium]